MTERKILLATDFSQESRRAYAPTVEFAKGIGASIILAHVVEVAAVAPHGAPLAPVQFPPDTQHRVQEVEEHLKKELEHLGDDVPVSIAASASTDAAEGLVALCDDHGATQMAISTHGRTGLRRLVLGSVAEAVVRHSKVPVICYPGH